MNSSLILLPFLAVVALNLLYKTALKKAALAVGLAFSFYQVFVSVFPGLSAWSERLDVLGTFFKFGLYMDPLAKVALVSVGIVAFAAFLSAAATISDETKRFNFINLLLIAVAGMNGIIMVRDIFTLYIFLEVTAVASFILIAFDKDMFGLEGAFKYLVLSSVATAFLLSSIALFLILAGSTDFAVISASLRMTPDTVLAVFAIALFLCGLFIKAGLMPFHGWLPDAYASAPASASVFLAGIVTKTVGVYTLIRLVTNVFGFPGELKQVLMMVGTLSIVLGAFAAMGQKDFKRMLSYSSISQVGYIVLGLGCGTGLGIAGALFHFFNHAIFKSLLFVNAASVEKQAGIREIDHASGLASRMPVTGATSVIASLSAAGIPPLAGFWSKLMIIVALWSARFYGYATIAVLASVLTLGYLLTLQRKMFFGRFEGAAATLKEAGAALSLAALVLAAVIIATGLFFSPLLTSFIFPAADMLKVAMP